MNPHKCDYNRDISSHKTTDYVEYVQLHVFCTVINIFNILNNILDNFMYKKKLFYKYIQMLIVNPG